MTQRRGAERRLRALVPPIHRYSPFSSCDVYHSSSRASAFPLITDKGVTARVGSLFKSAVRLRSRILSAGDSVISFSLDDRYVAGAAYCHCSGKCCVRKWK